MLNQQPPTKKIKHFSSTSLVNAIPIEIWRDEIGTKLKYFIERECYLQGV